MLNKSQTLELLEKLGHNPKHGLGQNFLIDKNIVAKAVRLAELGPDDCVLEVGPGLGTLTEAILATGAKLTSIEMDRSFAGHLREAFANNLAKGQWTPIEADATKVDLSKIKFNKIVANLPYAVSSVLLASFLEAAPESMTLMVQRELADRYCASSGKHFSALSIFLQSAYSLKIATPVPPTCFFPPPKVQSCLLVLKKLPSRFSLAPNAKSLSVVFSKSPQTAQKSRRRYRVGPVVRRACGRWPYFGDCPCGRNSLKALAKAGGISGFCPIFA
jgi:16S rRNA (adenine1518-N6/adenine1519-N6)-dimethyltransferase